VNRQALGICQEAGYRVGQADALRGIGSALAGADRCDDAVTALEQAIEIGRELGESDVQLGALNELGNTLHRAGRSARDTFESALAMAGETGDRYEQARALDGLARVLHDAGDVAAARDYRAQALTIFRELGVPEGRPL